MATFYAKLLLGRVSSTRDPWKPCIVSVSRAFLDPQKTLSLFGSRNFNVQPVESPSHDPKPANLADSAPLSAKNGNEEKSSDNIYIPSTAFSESFATMPISSVTGSIMGKKFYKNVATREADDGNGWTIMLDYRTLRTPSKRPLKLPTLGLAKAVAAEWEYQPKDGIRPFTMPLMRLSCTALERVPLTRERMIENMMQRFHTDQVFCRAPEDDDLTSHVHDLQAEFMDPLFDWVESELGVRPVTYTSIFGGKQPQEVLDAMESLLKKTSHWELAAIDALAAAAHSLTIAVAIFRYRLQVEESVKLIRLEEDMQVDKWGLVEGGHDIDMADLRVQISSAVVFLGLLQNC